MRFNVVVQNQTDRERCARTLSTTILGTNLSVCFVDKQHKIPLSWDVLWYRKEKGEVCL